MKTDYKNQNIGIRPYKTSDQQSFFEAVKESNDHAAAFLPWMHKNYSLENAKHWIKTRPQAWDNKEAFCFAIYDLASEEYIGDISLNQMNWTHKIGNMGYWIRKSKLGKGYTVQAGKLIAEFGFKELKLNRIEVVVSVANINSQRVAEQLGTKEGLARHRLLIHDRCVDAFVYAILPKN